MPGPQQDRDYAEFVRNIGFDFTRDLDRAAIAFGPGSLAGSTNSTDTRTLTVVDAKFDPERIKAYALRTGHVVKVGGYSVYEVLGDPAVSFYFISGSRIELASGNNPTDILRLDRNHASAMDSALQKRIYRVAGAPIFAVGRTDNLPVGFYSNFKNSPQLLGLIHSIREITAAAQPEGNDLYVTLDAECSSLHDAVTMGTLVEGLRLFGSSAIADAKKKGQMSTDEARLLNTLLSQARVNAQGNWVRLSIELTPSILASNPAK